MPLFLRVLGTHLYRVLCLVYLLITLSLFHAPSSIIATMDKLVRDFFWEGSCGDGGTHNVNWGLHSILN